MWLQFKYFSQNFPLKSLRICKQCCFNLIQIQRNVANRRFHTVRKTKIKLNSFNTSYIYRQNLFTSIQKHSAIKNVSDSSRKSKSANKSDVKRLLLLMKPEKWKLTGMFISNFH